MTEYPKLDRSIFPFWLLDIGDWVLIGAWLLVIGY
jgi:hypothetical protein